MARAAAKGGKRTRPDARRPAKSSGKRQLSAAEQTLFFSRIRTHAKWVFVLLAVVFAGGFVFFGVGSGSGAGAGSLGDLFNNLFHGGSSGPSISKAQKDVAAHPGSAKALKDLATAYQASSSHSADAIATWQRYLALKPKDVSALAQLATLQTNQAQSLQTAYSSAQLEQQQATAGSLFAPSSTSALGKAIGQDPVQQLQADQASSKASAVASSAASAYTGVLTTYEKLAKLRPKDASVQLELAQAAVAAGNAPVAIVAYKRVAKLEPAQAAQINAIVKQLEKAAGGK
jgi:tetratricopeptide (TPR) repeat protein